MPGGSRVTILDVAARAGVHAGTVSRALSHPDRVAPATRERIEAVVAELGFVPSRAARGLITGRTGIAAVIVPDITNPYFASLVRAVERAAREADLQVFLVDTGEDPAEEVRVARTMASDVDGFVVLSPRQLHRQLDVFGSKPVVFVNRSVADHGSVLIRTAPAMAAALRHLASVGHRSVAYLTGPEGSWSASERRNSVRRTCRSSGIDLLEIGVESPTFGAAVETVEAILASDVTAVLAFNDQMALGVIAGLHEHGVAVPEQISVVGCDDVPMAAMVAPSLTTISMPTDEAGAAATTMLLGDTTRRELTGTLVVRRSTGPVMPRRATAVSGGKPRP